MGPPSAGASGPDDAAPSAERQRALLEQRMADASQPYAGVKLLTRGELLWLLEREGWTARDDAAAGPRAQLAGIDLSHVNLGDIDLRHADLSHANLEHAVLDRARLDGAHLYAARLNRAGLRRASLKHAVLKRAQLRRANLRRASLVGADFTGAVLTRAMLAQAVVTGAQFVQAQLSHADLSGIAQDLSPVEARLSFVEALLEGASLRKAALLGASLYQAVLSGADLSEALLAGVDLRKARMDVFTSLERVELDRNVLIADVVWNGTPLEQVDWGNLTASKDEALASAPDLTRAQRLDAYEAAARGYHALAVSLRAQGLSTAAAHFHLREMEMKRKALWYQRKRPGWAFSWVLKVVAGYGELPQRTALVYLFVVGLFAAIFFVATNRLPDAKDHLAWYDAILLSASSFHGRGFFQVLANPGDVVSAPAALEAVIGLFIEAIFVATFTRRFLE